MKRSRGLDEDTPDPASPTTLSSVGDPGSGGSVPSYEDEATDTSPPASKIAGLDPSSSASSDVAMRCSLPPHREPLFFATYEDYETHYQKTHTNRCLECRRNFPSAHLLGVHIEEMHDSFAQVMRDRGERTYSCFVEGCDRKCSTPQKRRLHLIDKHMYPKNFFFAVTREGIDGRRSLLLESGHRRRRSSVATTSSSAKPESGNQALADPENAEASTDIPQATTDSPTSPNQKPDVAMDDLASSMSALQFVPPSIRFGRGGRKAGFAKR